MKLKVYLGDWMINAGIIGFIHIIDNEKSVFKNDNYIEFDSSILENFSDKYFEYYFNKYNIANKVESRISSNIEYIQRKPEKIKDSIKYIKDEMKTQQKKIEKIDVTVAAKMKTIIDDISQIKNIDELDKLEQYVRDFLELISIEKINKKITLNFTKSILSDFFGQNSFLNVTFNKLSYDEQKNIMYKNYISDIIESCFLNEYVTGIKKIEELNEHIAQVLVDTKIGDAIKWYQTIQNKYIDKNKTEIEIKKYINEKVLSSCTLCGCESQNTSDYTEGNFIPLAMSSDNALNFFYNQNNKMPICSLCKLLMFCIPAGLNKVTKVNREYEKGQITYHESQAYNFVNYDTDVDTLLNTNDDFTKRIQTSGKEGNTYSEMILDIISQKKKTSTWELENIFVVELDSKYREYSRIEYFNIQKYIAKFFTTYSQKTLSHIKSKSYKLQIVDCILKNKDIGQAIIDNTRNCMLKKVGTYQYPFDSFLATKIRLYLNILKKGGNNLEEKGKKLNVLYNIGIEIHEKLSKNRKENKLDGYSYKLLNSINSGDKAAFMDVVIRLHMVMNKDVSPIFLDVMKEEELDFESIGHSFVSGLISNRYTKNNIEDKKEETENE